MYLIRLLMRENIMAPVCIIVSGISTCHTVIEGGQTYCQEKNFESKRKCITILMVRAAHQIREARNLRAICFGANQHDKLGPNKSALTEENSCEYDPKEKHNHIIQAISSEHEAADQPLM